MTLTLTPTDKIRELLQDREPHAAMSASLSEADKISNIKGKEKILQGQILTKLRPSSGTTSPYSSLPEAQKSGHL